MEATATEWIDACIYVMEVSTSIGSKVYPFIFGASVLRVIFEVV